MNHNITKRINKIDNPENYIGCLVNTNLSPTIKARLVGVGERVSYFEVVETEYEKIKCYNSTVGTIFDVPNHMVNSMDFIHEN